jgi:transposase
MTLLIYEKLKHIVTTIITHFKIKVTAATTGRPLKINPIDALTLALYQHTSTRATKKSVWSDCRDMLQCSYKTFVVAVNRSGMLALRILYLIMRLGKKHSHLIKYTDATDIPVCLKKNADSHRTMKSLSGFGYSSKGWYYGLKMTMTRDAEGRILGIRFSHPSANDRMLFREINKDIHGLLIADAGYVSKELERDMHIEGKRWTLIRPFKNMKRLATWWQLKLYEGRFQIELDFRSLKMFFGLVASLPRSVNGYLSNYAHALLAYALR